MLLTLYSVFYTLAVLSRCQMPDGGELGEFEMDLDATVNGVVPQCPRARFAFFSAASKVRGQGHLLHLPDAGRRGAWGVRDGLGRDCERCGASMSARALRVFQRGFESKWAGGVLKGKEFGLGSHSRSSSVTLHVSFKEAPSTRWSK